jgi:hypothetical protein
LAIGRRQAEEKIMAVEGIQLSVGLASGAVYSARKIKLFPEAAVSRISELTAQASAKLGGISTGLGFWGDPVWVLAGAVVLTAIERALADKTKRKVWLFCPRLRRHGLHCCRLERFSI